MGHDAGIAGENFLKQGPHPDPEDPAESQPDPSTWSARRRNAFESKEMAVYRSGVRLNPDLDVRKSVVDDLHVHYGMDRDECVRRCIHWEEWSVQEWQEGDRETADGIRDFYHRTRSWAFDLAWYAYLQCEGYLYPVSVAIARTLAPPGPGARHLDFGSGIGTTSQLFIGLGWASDLADVSPTLLDFARFRLERRSCRARYIDLNEHELQSGAYDVITAVDVLTQVPDLRKTAEQLHRALKPGGLLFANFDVRPMTPENAWHLYDEDLPLRWDFHRSGFEAEQKLDMMVARYRSVEPTGMAHALRGLRDLVLLRSPLRPAYRRMRFQLQRARG